MVDLLPRRKAILESVFDGSLTVRSGQSIRGRHDACDASLLHKGDDDAYLRLSLNDTPPPTTKLLYTSVLPGATNPPGIPIRSGYQVFYTNEKTTQTISHKTETYNVIKIE